MAYQVHLWLSVVVCALHSQTNDRHFHRIRSLDPFNAESFLEDYHQHPILVSGWTFVNNYICHAVHPYVGHITQTLKPSMTMVNRTRDQGRNMRYTTNTVCATASTEVDNVAGADMITCNRPLPHHLSPPVELLLQRVNALSFSGYVIVSAETEAWGMW